MNQTGDTRYESEVWKSGRSYFQVKINQISEFFCPVAGEPTRNVHAGEYAVRVVSGAKWLSEKFFSDVNEALAYGETLIGK